MEIQITEIEKCKLAVHYEANAEEIKEKKTEVLNAFKNAPVRGFRKNKAPMDAIRIQYAKQIDESLKRAMAEHALHSTIFEKNLKVHGPPKFNSLLLEGGKFICEFETLTKPDFTLPDWKNMEIPRPVQEHTTEEVAEKMLQELRVRLGDVIPFTETDFVQNGDNVVLDYDGFADGVKIDSLSVKSEMMTVGKSPLVGFDNNLIGMTPGEMREFDFVSPEGGLPSLSGKTIHFQVTLNTGSKTIPAALDDTLAQKLGKKDFAELREAVVQASFARVETFNKSQVNDAVSRKLIADTEIDVPPWMSVSEAQYLCQQSHMDWNTLPDPDREKFIEMAIQNVKLSLILDRVREDEPEAQLSDQEVFDIIKTNLLNNNPQEKIDDAINQMNKSGYLTILFSRIKDENTLNCITKAVKLID